MIEINGNEFYTAEDAVNILQMKYSSVIYLLRQYKIPKYKNKYYITNEQMQQMKNRQNQYMKLMFLNEDDLNYKKIKKSKKF